MTASNEDVERNQFLSHLFNFMAQRGTSISYIPIFDHRELDLYKLYRAVTSRGGLARVVESKLWRQVTCDLGVDQDRTDAGFRLRMHYLKYLYPYERKFYLNLPDDDVTTRHNNSATAIQISPATLRLQHPRASKSHDRLPLTTLASSSSSSPITAPIITSVSAATSPPLLASPPPPQQMQMQMQQPQQQQCVLAYPIVPASGLNSPVTVPSPNSSFEALYAAASTAAPSMTVATAMMQSVVCPPTTTTEDMIISPPPPSAVSAPLAAVLEQEQQQSSVMSTPPSHPVSVQAKVIPFVLHEYPHIPATPTSTTPNTPIKQLSLSLVTAVRPATVTVATTPAECVDHQITKVPHHVFGVHKKESPLRFGKSISATTSGVDFNKLDVRTLLRCKNYLLHNSESAAPTESDGDSDAEDYESALASKNRLCEDVAQQFGAVNVDEFTAIRAFLLRMGWHASN